MSANDDMKNMSVRRQSDDSSLGNANSTLDTGIGAVNDSADKVANKTADGVNPNNQASGGMSAIKDERAEEQAENAKKDKKNKGIVGKTANAVGTVHTVHSAMMAANLVMMLKMMGMGIAQTASTAGNAILSFFINAAHGVMSFGASFISGVAGFFGTSAAVVGSVLGSAVSFACVGLSVAIVSISTTTAAVRDAVDYVDCSLNVSSTIASFTGNMLAQTEVNAKNIYSVYKAAGFSDEQIAGVLGNFHKESVHIDPTSVEGIFDEPFTVGPKKQAAQACNFILSSYLPGYSYGGNYKAGVGLAGFTAENNTALCDFAESKNKNWYDLDVQIAFSMSAYASAGWLNNTYKTTSYSSVDKATEDFMNEYERPAASAADLAGRQSYAAGWYTKIKTGWSVNQTYANSVLAMANTAASGGTNSGAASLINNCKSAQSYDNSSLASAIVSYAWETTDEGNNNNGTTLYQTVNDNIFGNHIYMSCDYTVACAVRWSGTDDSYPSSNVGTQIDYCISSNKWTEVTNWNGDRNNLQPGDIIFEGDDCRGHTLMYVGNDIIKAKYPNATPEYCLVSGSYGERSPGCQKWYDSSPRRVFRNVERESNPQYTDAGSSAN